MNGNGRGGGSSRNSNSNSISSRNNVFLHEELVPLKGGPIEDLPRRRRPGPCNSQRCKSLVTIGASLVALLLCGWALTASLLGNKQVPLEDTAELGATEGATKGGRDSIHLYDELGRYILEDYDAQPPFSDFLPALAGYYGKPLYAFYVNRGQGIASFGIKSKDYPIMKFSSANDAYQTTAARGFRTFLQGYRPQQQRGNKAVRQFVTEPFSPLSTRHEQVMTASDKSAKVLPKRYMYIGSNEMQLREVDTNLGIETNVTYFILPEEDFGAFVKRTTITNTESTELKLSMLDGLAKIEPAGGKLFDLLATIGRTLEGWMGVYQPYEDTIKMPFYRLSTQPGDTAAVVVQKAGHWCLSIMERGEPELLPIVYDTSTVFGEDTALLTPVQLFTKSIGDIIKGPQYGFAKTSSAFSAVDEVTLAPGESLTVATFFGKADDILDVPVVARRLTQPGLVQYKMKRAREIIKQITASVETKTSNPLFDGHVQQMFLDNSLRGGIPSILGEVDDDARLMSADEDHRLKVYHLFSRIHGDLERDYNDFEISPTFFSQGPGNFRDVAQNRRIDVVFNPRIGSFNVKTFLTLIQADGYNPLSVEAVVFTIKDFDVCQWIATRAVGEADGHRAQREALTGILNSGPFRPGQLFLLMEEQNIELVMSMQEFIDMVIAAAESHPMAVFEKGFWADHFTYYMDLIDSYLAVYPDREERLMFDERLPYYFSPAYVRPRREKYVLSVSFDGTGKHVRQLDATVVDKKERAYQARYVRNETGWYDFEATAQRDVNGDIFTTSPIGKLFVLATLKFSTRDPYGMGIEYEGGRPGWDDANNGLVGMLGSGMPETYELSVLIQYIVSTVKKYGRAITIPLEVGELVTAIENQLDKLLFNTAEDGDENLSASVPFELFEYWDNVASARETYRKATKTYFTGDTKTYEAADVIQILERWLKEIDKGVKRALHFGTEGAGDDGKTGITPTYFSYNVTKWENTGRKNLEGHHLVIAQAFNVSTFPLFLEGPTRMMKTVGKSTASQIYQKVRVSPLRDEGLKMYTISASLKGQSFDMGREMAFAAGWLENQSVWLHMSYKYYLELLRQELFDEFFDEMTSGGMLPFMDEKVYGRSLMECSSFIASSSFTDPAIRGRGFLARLSGSTAEFLSMWMLMMLGPKPFYLDDVSGELHMQLVPALPRWFFDDSLPNTAPFVSFKLFGAIDVTYFHLRGTSDLYRTPPSRYIVGLRDGSTFHVDGGSIPSDLADKIRRVVFVASIEAYFE